MQHLLEQYRKYTIHVGYSMQSLFSSELLVQVESKAGGSYLPELSRSNLNSI
jgi:hypothetical protein